jgi:hypothetical protein
VQRGTRVALLLLALVSLAAGGQAREARSFGPTRFGLEPSSSTRAEPTSEDPTTDQTAEEDTEKPAFRWTRFRLHGRAIGRWISVSQGDTSESDVDLDDARLTLNWRPGRWLRGQLEYDAAANRKLKDAYLQGRTEALSLRVGQFKPPLSVVAMDSRWDLPVSRRGQLDEVLAIMGIIGRRPGLQLGYQPAGATWTSWPVSSAPRACTATSWRRSPSTIPPTTGPKSRCGPSTSAGVSASG